MKITVKNREKKEIESKEGQSILEALQEYMFRLYVQEEEPVVNVR